MGTKSDLISGQMKREVSFQEAIDFAKRQGLGGVLETSAKSDPNSCDCFLMAAARCTDFENAVQMRKTHIQQNFNGLRYSMGATDSIRASVDTTERFSLSHMSDQ